MRRRSFLALAASLALCSHRGSTLAAQTPVAVDADIDLLALLRLLPDAIPAEPGIRYANYAAQLAAVGIPGIGEDLDPDTWTGAMGIAMMTPMMMSMPMDPAWRDGFGFDLRDVHQMVERGPSDESILLLAGRFDAASLPALWQSAGYAATETDGVTWYTLGEDNVITFDDPVHMLHLGALSHIALLDDGTIAGASKRVDMERVLALHAGTEASLSDGPGRLLAAAPDDLAAGWIVDGATLVPIGDPLAGMATNPNVPAEVQERLATQAAGIAEEAPRMPPIALALVGATAGAGSQLTAEAFPDLPAGHAVAVVVPVNGEDAAMVAETVTRRLTTLAISGSGLLSGRPYAEAFPGMVVDATPGGAVVIDLEPAPDVYAGDLIRLLQDRQLSILFWGG